ncbi:MAG TPA: carbamoyltransferase HypF [Acidimicrobiales bacterium]|nr:carbamoyltransferase HypF [Acidimicrobiales bacterium]
MRVTGTVQGVGFRPFVYRLAVELGLSGHVANDSRGVVIDVGGPVEALEALERRLADEAPPLAHIASLQSEPVEGDDDVPAGFQIVDSRAEGAPAVAVSVDVATCADCLAELYDPDDRRFEYPFINCTNCGPRYTIIRSIPYDRASTTMAPFAMCNDCRREYEDPSDRRFHAEPNACPVCGPHLRLVAPDGSLLGEQGDALQVAAAMLVDGRILAIKGLGGYHLAADATNEEAVAELRRRKARDDKPFAVMVSTVDAARALCDLPAAAAAVLSSPRRPIVLAHKIESASISDKIAPSLPELGLMLPYTPLHDLLLSRVGRPLVMTSGNLSDEPIAHDDSDALARLGPMVDAVLLHDRAIEIRCDDSVVRSLPRRTSATQLVRRSRGYAPEPIHLSRPTARQVLAVGAELKNTVSVAKGDNVITSHHIGDLKHLAAYQSFLQAIDHLCRLTGVSPEVVAHDLHPEYLSTKFAADLDVAGLAVQHHHAHIASCLVEHGHEEPVLGIAFDGLGMGPDGTLWGGEFLIADLTSYRRVGHLRQVALPGGNQAIREPWRMALSWTYAAAGAGAASDVGRQTDERWPAVLRMIQREDTITTSSAGRLFDASAALLGVRNKVTYEGQAAIELEALASSVLPDKAPTYDMEQSRVEGMLVLDPARLIRTVIKERERGTAAAVIAAGFHAALGKAAAKAARELATENGIGTVALSGGVFQNARLTTIVVGELEASDLKVLVHERVPPNDGGISVGQAGIAAATPA